MIEKITLRLTGESTFEPDETISCEEMNPKVMLLYAGAKCAGMTALAIMRKERLRLSRFEISYSGELPDDGKRAPGVFRSFHVVYDIACDCETDQAKAARAATLAHEKYCGVTQMLRAIAPVSHEIAVVGPQPAR